MSAPPPPLSERAILVALEREGMTHWEVEDSLAELRQLTTTAGAQIVDVVIQKLDKPTAPTFIGKGKAMEIARLSAEKSATMLVFDEELSPAQGRNLEAITDCKVLDRTQLILDIFARRARTREGRLQIELAQLHYLLPRLTRMWTHLSRQSGGIGTRGPGETQLEVDRRRVQERITRIERDLREVRKHRTIQREGRLRHNWPVASLVGYTNAGKSSFLNRLTQAGVQAEDKLFATLDPTTRQLVLPNRQKILLTDTVGFIRKLPHTLIEAFKATLEEVKLADILIHIVDVSHPRFHEQMAAVEETVAELDAAGKQMLIVFNKADAVADPAILENQLLRHPGSVALSARTGKGVDDFFQELELRLEAWRKKATFRIPNGESAVLAEIHRVGHVLSVRYEGNFAMVVAHIPPELTARLAPYTWEAPAFPAVA